MVATASRIRPARSLCDLFYLVGRCHAVDSHGVSAFACSPGTTRSRASASFSVVAQVVAYRLP